MKFNGVNNQERLQAVFVSGFVLLALVAFLVLQVVELNYWCGGKNKHFVLSIILVVPNPHLFFPMFIFVMGACLIGGVLAELSGFASQWCSLPPEAGYQQWVCCRLICSLVQFVFNLGQCVPTWVITQYTGQEVSQSVVLYNAVTCTCYMYVSHKIYYAGLATRFQCQMTKSTKNSIHNIPI